jgi:Zn-dependent peptidase ImmA (M78 family)/DNA-binding XRE family transcriptional regulator
MASTARSTPEEGDVTRSVAEQVGGRIRRAREARGLSQAELAEALGLSQAAISNIESGNRPVRVDELVSISHAIGEELEFFFPRSDQSRGAVGVTLRAEVANLPLPDFREAIGVFVDEIENAPLPEVMVSVSATDPEDAAKQVLEKSGVKSPPVDVMSVARSLGVAVFPRPFPDALSALLLRYDAHAFIGVNSHQARTRQRFSVAHELGHFVLHHEDRHFIDYGTSAAVEGEAPGYDWKSEQAANRFAAELLMPEEMLRRESRSISLSRLTTRYEVSQEAMGFRLANLGL